MASEKHSDPTSFQDTKTVGLDVSGLTQSADNESRHGIKEFDLTRLWIRLMTFLRWYPNDMLHEEKSLVLKLDLSILIFGCLSFFTKYLDQQSITNAYVRYVTFAKITDKTPGVFC